MGFNSQGAMHLGPQGLRKCLAQLATQVATVPFGLKADPWQFFCSGTCLEPPPSGAMAPARLPPQLPPLGRQLHRAATHHQARVHQTPLGLTSWAHRQRVWPRGRHSHGFNLDSMTGPRLPQGRLGAQAYPPHKQCKSTRPEATPPGRATCGPHRRELPQRHAAVGTGRHT